MDIGAGLPQKQESEGGGCGGAFTIHLMLPLC
jgi:hypothetical protein